jgi:hypothetical protein
MDRDIAVQQSPVIPGFLDDLIDEKNVTLPLQMEFLSMISSSFVFSSMTFFCFPDLT